MATRKKTTPKKASKKKGAAKKGVTLKKERRKKNGSSSSESVNPLHLVEFRVFARVFIALVFAGGIYWLAGVRIEQPENGVSSSKNNPAERQATLSGHSYDDFTFYSDLKNFEVKVAEDNPYARNDSSETVYLIQAGAFKTHERAEEHLVQLTLLDFDPHIEKSNSWYRVLIGPLISRSKMSATRNRLLENGIQAKVMKQVVKKN